MFKIWVHENQLYVKHEKKIGRGDEDCSMNYQEN